MSRSEDVPAFEHDISEAIREHAMAFPEAAEGASCVNRAFSAGGKNFAFLGEKADTCTLRVKLASGWEKIEFTADEPPHAADVFAWVTESFELLAPKRVRAVYESGRTDSNQT